MALDAYKMRIVAQGLRVLRQKVVMLRLVNQDFSLEARSKNEVIIIPESSAQTVHNVSASAAHPALKQVNPSPHELRLDQWKESYFDATDKDETEANVGWFMRQTEEAAKALGNSMDKFAHRLIARYCPFGTGTAGTTPFDDTLDPFFTANEGLNNGTGRRIQPLRHREHGGPDQPDAAIGVRCRRRTRVSGHGSDRTARHGSTATTSSCRRTC